MMKVFVRITGQLSTAISPVVGSMSSVMVPCNLVEEAPSYRSRESVMALVAVVGVGFARGGSAGVDSGKAAGSMLASLVVSWQSETVGGCCAVSSVTLAFSEPGMLP